MREHSDWLESLNPGDEVFYSNIWGGLGDIVKVDRVTATRIIAGNQKFRRTDGRRIGSSGVNIVSIRRPTQADRDKIETHVIRRKVEKYANSDSCELSVLRAMVNCMKEPKP